MLFKQITHADLACAGDMRAATEASLLKRYGAGDVVHLVTAASADLAREGVRLETDLVKA